MSHECEVAPISDECAICKEAMSVETFQESAEEGLYDDCFRLPCKHAFHAACIIGSLRASGSTCPICRDGSPPPVATHVFEFEVDTVSTNSDNDRLNDLQSRDRRVQAGASNLNRAVKSFNIFRDKLRSIRRKTLAVAMREFRTKYKRGFALEKERVRQALASYTATVNAATSEPIELVDIDGLIRQPNTHASMRKQDPSVLSFWYY